MQPVSAVGPDRMGPREACDDHRGVAAMEFAIIAPIMFLLIWGVWDVTRALLAWEETYHAAEAIAQAAEKLSYSTRTYDGTNNPVTALSAQQMQDAMSSIYAEMPWLHLGDGGGLFQGKYQVTLSGISFNPLCVPGPNGTTCTGQPLPQLPFVLWSSYLAQGGTQQLIQGPALWRQCLPVPIPIAQFPNNSSQLLFMADPNVPPVGTYNLILIPQVVADVAYTFTPSFPLLSGFSYTFYASASFPAPVGGDTQAIVFDAEGYNGSTVLSCPGGLPYNG